MSTELARIVGLSGLGGSSLRTIQEVKSWRNALTEIYLEHLELSNPAPGTLDTIIEHLDITTNFYERLAINKLHTSTQDISRKWNKYKRHLTIRDLRLEVGLRPQYRKDNTVCNLMRKQAYAKLQNVTTQKIRYEITRASEQSWFMVFDTLKLANHSIPAFQAAQDSSAKPIGQYCKGVASAIRASKLSEYRIEVTKQFKSISLDSDKYSEYFYSVCKPSLRLPKTKAVAIDRMVSAMHFRLKRNQSSYYRYVCVPEYGSDTGRLHYHLLHLMQTMPVFPGESGDHNTALDPNYGRPARNYREIKGFSRQWPYSNQNTAIAVRHNHDAFTNRLGWFWPLDSNKQAIPVKSPVAVASYMAKYISKSVDELESASDRWASTVKSIVGRDVRIDYRISSSNGFGWSDLKQSALSIPDDSTLVELARLEYTVSPYYYLIGKVAKIAIAKRFPGTPVSDLLVMLSDKFDFVGLVKGSLGMKGGHTDELPERMRKLTLDELSDNAISFLSTNGLLTDQQPDPGALYYAPK